MSNSNDYSPGDPLPVELVPRPDNRLLLAVIVVLGTALLVGMVSTTLGMLYDKTIPDVMAVTIGTVAGSLGTLLVRSSGPGS